MPPDAKYKSGDLVKFRFTPNAYDREIDEVTLIGVVLEGPLVASYKRDIVYKVELVDEKRKINGSVIVPEQQISEKVPLGVTI